MNNMKNLLLIDDDKLFSNTIQTILQADGFDVSCCDSGSQALSLLKNKCFQAAIVDYHLPGMNGVEITSLLRTRSPHTLIIGFSLDNKEKEFLGAGADTFYPKPQIADVLSRLGELT
jgi:DNA-binding response OmpR family regulator